MKCLLAILLCAWAGLALADYDATSSRGTDLSGTWLLNAALSDDVESLLAQQLEEQRERDERWWRRQERARPPGAPIDESSVLDDRARSRATQRPWQRRRYETFQRMLEITKTLTIRQQGTMMEVVSSRESRRVEAGTHSQVSMPQGQIADSEVGWDGDWFVINRRVRNGPRVVEQFRLLAQTDQLEYRMKWSGDTELAGMKVRRIFDRTAGVALRNPAVGPVR